MTLVDDCVTIVDAARMLACSSDTIRRRIKANELPSFKFNGRFLIKESDVIDYALRFRYGWSREELRNAAHA